MATLVPTEAQRQYLKQPLGELVRGTPAQCVRTLKDIVEKEKPPCLVLVGDTVAKNAVQFGMRPDVIIIDNLEKRQKAAPFQYAAKHVFRTGNPAGTIQELAWHVIEQAIKQGNSLVMVEGEEDLLTLAAISSSPDNSIVVYGQPGEGIVLVRATPQKKGDIQRIMEQMERKS